RFETAPTWSRTFALEGRQPRPDVIRRPGARTAGRAALRRRRARVVEVRVSVDGTGGVAGLVHAPAKRMARGASRVVGANVAAGVYVRRRIGRRGRVLGRAAVVLHEAVADRCREAHVDRHVRESLGLPQRDRIVAAVVSVQVASLADTGGAAGVSVPGR